MPYPDFTKSLLALDYRRLGKQREEAYQLLKGDWPNHPASRMWVGYWPALAHYASLACDIWVEVWGYTDTTKPLIQIALRNRNGEQQNPYQQIEMPNWFGDERFHASHRANLLRKDFNYYHGKHGWREYPGMSYVWPKSDRLL